MNLNALEVVRRVVAVDDPTDPAGAGAVHGDPEVAALGRLVDGPLAVVGVGDVAGDVVGAELAGHLLGAVLVAVEDRAPHAEGRELARRALAQPGRAAGDDCGDAVEVHAAHATGAPPGARQGAAERVRPQGTKCSPRHAVLRGGGLDGEEVDPVVHLVAGVALHPGEPHRPGGVERQLEQRLPQVPVGDGLARRVAPAPTLPSLPPPVAEAIDHVGRVAVDVHRALDRLERPDHGGDLHPLVGRARLGAAGEGPVGHRPRPAPGPGVPEARTVGVHDGLCAVGLPLDPQHARPTPWRGWNVDLPIRSRGYLKVNER